ncbi:queuine tRNA-ribosyltransferase family protein [Patescibacteria group bacterium]|nr:queuine tRNA-ribosyltransferase family protein [Patescibacteria group bacterium]
MISKRTIKKFKSRNGDVPLPVFFPDATRAVIRTLDSSDIEGTKTPGILVNTYHLYKDLGKKVVEEHEGIRQFMSWSGALISDSGGFQVMSLAKRSDKRGTINDDGVTFKLQGKEKITLTPEKSIQFQMVLKPDMVVVLDDFTEPGVGYEEAKDTVDRTILWAKKSKEEFLKICEKEKIKEEDRPYLLGVVQGGEYLDLREYCAKELVKIGFDGFGYGGWPIKDNGDFNYDVARVIAENSPADYLLYGLGIGKPDEIVKCFDMGYYIFDCVLPTRDARHSRLYVYNANSISDINVRDDNFYSFFDPSKQKYYHDTEPVSKACDCLLCTRYTRSYLHHLFKNDETTSLRLATIHNLRFYSLLMERLGEELKS